MFNKIYLHVLDYDTFPENYRKNADRASKLIMTTYHMKYIKVIFYTPL